MPRSIAALLSRAWQCKGSFADFGRVPPRNGHAHVLAFSDDGEHLAIAMVDSSRDRSVEVVVIATDGLEMQRRLRALKHGIAKCPRAHRQE
jgi:predicted DNA-binding protein with PD1-like motif